MGIKENLKKGAVELLILNLLSEKDMYGYQIAQEIDRRSQGLFTVLEGSLYPILFRLTQSGYLTEQSMIVKKRNRIYYHMLDSGREYLARCMGDYDSIMLGMRRVMYPEDLEQASE